ncbi:MAG: hypothetical protein ACREE4_04865, partial [Stellaceae bacterium]
RRGQARQRLRRTKRLFGGGKERCRSFHRRAPLPGAPRPGPEEKIILRRTLLGSYYAFMQ